MMENCKIKHQYERNAILAPETHWLAVNIFFSVSVMTCKVNIIH